MPDNEPTHLYRSVLLRKSELTSDMLTNILTATTHGINIADPDIYIMVRIKENLTAEENANTLIPAITTFQQVEFVTASGKGNPPGTRSL